MSEPPRDAARDAVRLDDPLSLVDRIDEMIGRLAAEVPAAARRQADLEAQLAEGQRARAALEKALDEAEGRRAALTEEVERLRSALTAAEEARDYLAQRLQGLLDKVVALETALGGEVP